MPSATTATRIRCSVFARARFIETDLRTRPGRPSRRTPASGPRWFRAPFGARWFGLGRAQRRLTLTGVMWTVIGYDWKLGADAVVERMPRARLRMARFCACTMGASCAPGRISA